MDYRLNINATGGLNSTISANFDITDVGDAASEVYISYLTSISFGLVRKEIAKLTLELVD
jgi:hypothetical protein